MAWFDPATSYASGGMDRETGQNLPAALWQRVMDSFSWLGGVTGNTKSGTLSIPAQPSFLAYNSAQDDNVTGNGTLATADFDTEVRDQGGDFASDTYTADVAGNHLLCGAVSLLGISSAMTLYVLTIVTSNRTYQLEHSLSLPSGDRISVPFCVIADMDAGDTALIRIAVSGGALVADIRGPDAGNLTTFFSGALLN